jgi:hypothetical protein
MDRPKDPSLPKPAPGASYTDPAFGTKITRITAADPSEGANAVIKTNYSTMPAWNADGSLILLWHRGGRRYEIHEGDEPYRHLATFSPGETRVNTDIEQILWDPVEPLVLYWPANYNARPRFWRATLRPSDWTAEYELVRDFSSAPTNCPDGDWGSLLSLGHDPHMGSLGLRKIVGLMCGDVKFLYSVAEDSVLAVRTTRTGQPPWPLPDESGAYFVNGAEVTDLGLNTLLRLSLPFGEFEHAALASGPPNTYNAVEFDGSNAATLVSHDLTKGTRRVVVGQENGWPYPKSDTHVSHGARHAPGWVAVSMVADVDGQNLLDNEILLANVLSGESCRVAHSRTEEGRKGGPWDYWAEPHPSISNDGYRIAFNSDWGGSDTVDTYIVDMRAQGLPPLAGTGRVGPDASR